MPRLRGAQITGPLVGALLAAGCSSGDSSSADPGASTPTSHSSPDAHVLFPITNSLRVARRQCLAGVKPINVAGGGFVCVEREEAHESVIGILGARGALWLLVMDPESEGNPRAELASMTALARAVPR